MVFNLLIMDDAIWPEAHLNFFVSERQKETLAMFCPQSINTSRINCASQVVIHFLLRIFLIVSAWTNPKSENIHSENSEGNTDLMILLFFLQSDRDIISDFSKDLHIQSI